MTRNQAPSFPQGMFNHLLKIMSGERFLSMQGLGNEVPFFICPFKPEHSLEMAQLQRHLTNRLEQSGIRVLTINLYDLSMELLRKRGIFKQVMDWEPQATKDELMEVLQGVLDPETHLIPAMVERITGEAFEILFVSGVGEVFPFIRSHNVLNNLQSKAKDRPTVLFFPGEYTHSAATGASLDLFGRLHDDKYYRAFNIFDCEV
jgi:hypothetical protein